MNERIKELALQCGAWHQVYDGKLLLINEYFNYEKLANLILDDVMSICEDLGDKGMDGHYCVDAIRKKFRS
jgi:hypothetical protein